MRQSKRDMLFAGSFFVMGILLLLIIPIFAPGRPGTQPDSRFFPRVIAVAIMAISVLMFANNLLKHIHEIRSEKPNEAPKSSVGWIDERRAFILFGIIAVYALLMKPVGFIISTVLATTAILLVLKVKKPLSYLIVYAFSAVIFLVFKYVLYVRLP